MGVSEISLLEGAKPSGSLPSTPPRQKRVARRQSARGKPVPPESASNDAFAGTPRAAHPWQAALLRWSTVLAVWLGY